VASLLIEAASYTEQDSKIPQTGVIALQIDPQGLAELLKQQD